MHYGMPRPDPELRKRLNAHVLDLTTYGGLRGSRLEDDGRSVGGRPRSASRKHAAMRRRAYGPKSQFDSMYTGSAS